MEKALWRAEKLKSCGKIIGIYKKKIFKQLPMIMMMMMMRTMMTMMTMMMMMMMIEMFVGEDFDEHE